MIEFSIFNKAMPRFRCECNGYVTEHMFHKFYAFC